MLLDANLLLYAVHERAEEHEPVASWLTEQLNGASRFARFRGLRWENPLN